MAEKYELAYVDYKAGMKQKEIAAKYDVSINTVKSWQQRKWKEMDAEGAGEKVCTPKESMHTEKQVQEEVSKPTIDVLSNDELTEKQSLFCWYFTRYWNATKAYKRVYDCDYNVARVNASRLLTNANIISEIERLKQEIANGLHVTRAAIIQKWIDIAFSDVTDFMDFGTEEREMLDEAGNVILDENDEPRTYTTNYVRFHNADSVDGSLISEVKQGKDGVSIKLMDKMKALDNLAKYLDVLSDNERTKYDEERKKMNAIVLKTELDIKLKNKELEILGKDDQNKDITINFVRKG